MDTRYEIGSQCRSMTQSKLQRRSTPGKTDGMLCGYLITAAVMAMPDDVSQMKYIPILEQRVMQDCVWMEMSSTCAILVIDGLICVYSWYPASSLRRGTRASYSSRYTPFVMTSCAFKTNRASGRGRGKPMLICILACSLAFQAITFERRSYIKIAFLKMRPV